jgi:hypothetical protein
VGAKGFSLGPTPLDMGTNTAIARTFAALPARRRHPSPAHLNHRAHELIRVQVAAKARLGVRHDGRKPVDVGLALRVRDLVRALEGLGAGRAGAAKGAGGGKVSGRAGRQARSRGCDGQICRPAWARRAVSPCAGVHSRRPPRAPVPPLTLLMRSTTLGTESAGYRLWSG